MSKKDSRFQKGDGRKKKFSGERSFSSSKKERGNEKSQFKRHENDGERSFSSAKKDSRTHKTASSASDLTVAINGAAFRLIYSGSSTFGWVLMNK